MTPGNVDKETAERIARWFARRQSGEQTPEEAREFADWLEESEVHREAFKEFEHALAVVDAAAPEMLAQQFEQELEEAYALSQQRKAFPIWSAIAASIVLAVGVTIALFIMNPKSAPAQQFATAIGERRDVMLEDGSSARLNTNSLVEVSYTRDLRKVNMKRGEAYFQVRRDPNRPFVVRTQLGEIKVTGTSFNVRSLESQFEVTVLSGSVLVTRAGETDPYSLREGDRLQMRKGGDVRIAAFDRETVLAWLQGKAIYKNQPLGEVVRDLNRYYLKPIVLSDEAAASAPVTGEFDIYDQTAAIEALAVAFDLEARAEPERIVLGPTMAANRDQ